MPVLNENMSEVTPFPLWLYILAWPAIVVALTVLTLVAGLGMIVMCAIDIYDDIKTGLGGD